LRCILRSHTIAVTGKALVVRVDAEDDLSNWLEHSSDRFRYLTNQKPLGSFVFGDPLYWVESGLADCAIVQLGVLDYRWNDVAHQLLLQEEYGVVDIMNVARARIHGWLAVCGSMS
jgi:hypothetical protein